MASPKLLLLLLLLVTTTVLTSALSSSSKDSTEFIRTSCGSTSYPGLCFSSLARYASAVKQSPLQLAQVATKVSLSRVQAAASRASTLYKKAVADNGTSYPTAKALKDCADLLGDAADNTKYSLSELKKLKGASGKQKLWKLSNVQTYMSAALTKEDTCTDGLKEEGAVVKDVSARVGTAKQYTSNALGLVNRLRYSNR